MREVVENNIKPKDAVKLYHSELKKRTLYPTENFPMILRSQSKF